MKGRAETGRPALDGFGKKELIAAVLAVVLVSRTLLFIGSAPRRIGDAEPLLRVIVIGSDEAKIRTTVTVLGRCIPSREAVALDVRFVQTRIEKLSKPTQLTWKAGPLAIYSSKNEFEALLEAWPVHPQSTERAMILREACVPCSKHFFSQIGDWFVHLRTVNDVSGISLTALPHTGGQVNSVGVQASCGFLPSSAREWTAFSSYMDSKRSEWFLWPDRKSARIGDWSLWMSRFNRNFEHFTIHPAVSLLAMETKFCSRNQEAARPHVDRFSEPFDADLNPVARKRPSVDVSNEEVDALVEFGRKQGGSVAITVVNSVFLPTARSWLCNVQGLGIQPPGIVWITTDDESYDVLSKIEGTRAIRFGMKGGQETGNQYGRPGYWQLMLERTVLFRKVLEKGVAIFAFETDQIWLRDPLPYIQDLVADGVEIVGTLDSRKEIGGNLLYLRPTVFCVRLWSEVTRRFLDYYEQNRIAKMSPSSHKYIPNDQSQLTALVLFDPEFRKKSPVVFRALSTELFVDGRWYEGFYKSAESKSPVLINNNFLIGVEKKTERAKSVGHWFVDEKTDRCLTHIVENLPSSPLRGELGQHRAIDAPESLQYLVKQ
mmetsp:Transcript_7259/g.22121  ORF Transcript_7259/g.22121 Transcript_7259/m.22121 type:complete len:602 (-) Transcript_7259:68-1873(-)